MGICAVDPAHQAVTWLVCPTSSHLSQSLASPSVAEALVSLVFSAASVKISACQVCVTLIVYLNTIVIKNTELRKYDFFLTVFCTLGGNNLLDYTCLSSGYCKILLSPFFLVLFNTRCITSKTCQLGFGEMYYHHL